MPLDTNWEAWVEEMLIGYCAETTDIPVHTLQHHVGEYTKGLVFLDQTFVWTQHCYEPRVSAAQNSIEGALIAALKTWTEYLRIQAVNAKRALNQRQVRGSAVLLPRWFPHRYDKLYGLKVYRWNEDFVRVMSEPAFGAFADAEIEWRFPSYAEFVAMLVPAPPVEE